MLLSDDIDGGAPALRPGAVAQSPGRDPPRPLSFSQLVVPAPRYLQPARGWRCTQHRRASHKCPRRGPAPSGAARSPGWDSSAAPGRSAGCTRRTALPPAGHTRSSSRSPARGPARRARGRRRPAREFEQASGVGDGQGSLACCGPWGHKELDTTVYVC